MALIWFIYAVIAALLIAASWALPRRLGSVGVVAAHLAVLVTFVITPGPAPYEGGVQAIATLLVAFLFNTAMLPVSLTAAHRRSRYGAVMTRNMKIALVGLLVAVLAILAAQLFVTKWFGKPATTKELRGTYVSYSDLARDEIRLCGDGTFSQFVAIKCGAETASSTGSWRYDPASGQLVLNEGFLRTVRELARHEVSLDHSKPSRGVCSASLPVRYWFGQLCFGLAKFDEQYWKENDN
ncbi:MAG: hypothetical protein ABR915_00880 [Thermoguttaceae bacterium]|jgi:hypothetical protein